MVNKAFLREERLFLNVIDLSLDTQINQMYFILPVLVRLPRQVKISKLIKGFISTQLFYGSWFTSLHTNNHLGALHLTLKRFHQHLITSLIHVTVI